MKKGSSENQELRLNKLQIAFCGLFWYNIFCHYLPTTNGAIFMKFSYNKLWKILIDRGMLKKDLKEKAKITSTTLAKMGKGDPVSMEVLGRICLALKVNIGDIVDFPGFEQ